MAEVAGKGKVGAVLVVGGGIAGMQAALDTAEGGFKVYLLEKKPSIGGVMSQLDKTFPTNDCAMCIMSPKLVAVGGHPNIKLITNAELESVEGSAGNFKVKILRHPRYVNGERCTGCGSCTENCPVRYKAYVAPVEIKVELEDEELEKVSEIIDKYEGERGALMPILQAVNERYRYLPGDVLKHIALKLNYPISSVYRVATFYNAFSLKPKGRHLINVCMGTSCYVRGGKRILDTIQRGLEISAGNTTKDLRFTLETVRCLGCCSISPVMAVDGETFGRIRHDKIRGILEQYG